MLHCTKNGLHTSSAHDTINQPIRISHTHAHKSIHNANDTEAGIIKDQRNYIHSRQGKPKHFKFKDRNLPHKEKLQRKNQLEILELKFTVSGRYCWIRTRGTKFLLNDYTHFKQEKPVASLWHLLQCQCPTLEHTFQSRLFCFQTNSHKMKLRNQQMGRAASLLLMQETRMAFQLPGLGLTQPLRQWDSWWKILSFLLSLFQIFF